jgi:ferrous iron transport protein B
MSGDAKEGPDTTRKERVRTGESLSQDILLLGNLQTGKTTLFRRLGHLRQRDMPLPLTSERLARTSLRPRLAERVKGAFADPPGRRMLIDSPGTATLFPQGEDEMVAAEALLFLRPDLLLLVADARNLRRSLALFFHAAQFGVPIVVALNMVDEARLQGIEVDGAALERELGVPVVQTVAPDGVGVGELLRRIPHARIPNPPLFGDFVEERLQALRNLLIALPAHQRGVAILLLSGNASAEALVVRELGRRMYARVQEMVEAAQRELPRSMEILGTDLFYTEAERVSVRVTSVTRTTARWPERFGHYAQHPIFGMGIAALVVVILYYFVGVLGATIVVDWFNEVVFQRGLVPFSEWALEGLPFPLLKEALLDPDFGLLPTGLFLALGVVFPVLLFFYLAFAVLQDSGYLARLSVLLDRHLRRVGLNGRGLVPLAMGFSCVTMALITTRLLQTRRERTIASFLLMLAVPCAPLLGVMLVVLGDLPASATALVFGMIALQLLLAGNLASRLLPGEGGDFIMELPPIRVPRVRHVLWMTWRQTYLFMREAVPYFLFATFLMFVFQRVGGLDLARDAMRPGFESLLGLPDETVQVMIKTFIRRENGAAELERLKDLFTPLQQVVTVLVMTFVAPCFNAAIILYKERGAGAATAILVVVTAYAFGLGMLVNHGCRLLGITFAG